MTTDAEAETLPYPLTPLDSLDESSAYDELRRRTPMTRVQTPYGEECWLATRYEDVRTVLSDPRFSRARSAERDEPRIGPDRSGLGLLSMDPPEHTLLRKAVAGAFTARRMEPLTKPIRSTAEELADRMEEMEESEHPVDLVEHFANPLSASTICAFIGVPPDAHGMLHDWVKVVMGTAELDEETSRRYAEETFGYMMGLLRERTAEPTDDLISTIVRAQAEQDRMSEEQAVWLALGLLIAGYENVAMQLVNSVHLLLARPEGLAGPLANPETAAHTVEELLRLVPLLIVGGFPRVATEDVQVGGTLVREGEFVLPDLNAANLDESMFANAGEFDPERSDRSHLAFGHGRHHCIGAPLARLQLKAGLETLARRFPGMKRADGALLWSHDRQVRGPVEYPVKW